MSAASFDPQRSKGHASKMQNGSLHQKENVHDNDFEPYLTGQSTQSNSYPSMTDPYLPSYYAPSIGFPYPLSEAPWSTGGDPPIPYLTPYGPLSNGDHHFLPDGVFGQPGALGSSVYPHRFNFFPENPAFSAWGPAAAAAAGSQGQQTSGSAYGGSYNYPPSSLGGTLVPDGQTGFHGDALNKAPGMNSLDQGMLGLKIGSGGGDIMGGQGSGLKAVGSAIGGPALQPTGNGALPSGGAPPSKPASWAAIAGKPAKPPQVKLMRLKPGAALPPPIKHNMNVGTWDKGPAAKAAPGQMAPPPHLHPHQQPPPLGPPHAGLAPQPMGPPPMQPLTLQPHHHHHHHHHPHPHHPHPPPPPQPYQTHLHGPPPPPQTRWVAPRNRNPSAGYGPGLEGCGGGGAMVPVGNNGGGGGGGGGGGAESHPVLEKLCAAHGYNPREFEWNLKHGRVFIIKSYSEDDVHRSIKYSIWCSTEHGNKRLDGAFRGARGPVYLLFSVNGSGHFCGVAEMRSPVDYGASAGVWAQDKWKGKFDVAWLFVKDVPNGQLRHVRLENNDNKPVTNSRDTQEVPLDKARQVLRIMASYRHTTSIFDDFSHYERRQEEEEEVRKTFEPAPIPSRSRLDQERQNRSKQ